MLVFLKWIKVKPPSLLFAPVRSAQRGDAAGAADLARQLLRRWPCWSLEGFNSAWVLLLDDLFMAWVNPKCFPELGI